jgi:hypothetical protein
MFAFPGWDWRSPLTVPRGRPEPQAPAGRRDEILLDNLAHPGFPYLDPSSCSICAARYGNPFWNPGV